MSSTTVSAQSIPEKITKTIICHKLIKPSSPTPPTQRWHNLSLTDQALSNSYVPVALFYTKEQLDNAFSSDNPISDQLSSLLEDSLSKILCSYYPYAGRLKDNTVVDCNDMGAEFYQVEINCPISFAIECHNPVIENMIFPQGVAPWATSSTDDRGLVIAQLCYFNCGGIVISIGTSHKIGDGCNGIHLFNDWAKITRDPNWPLPSLHYVQQSIYPSEAPLLNPVINPPPNMKDCVQKRFIFSTTKIHALKALVADVVQYPSRTEVVAALLFKCALATSKNLQATSFTYAIDVRGMVNLSPNCVGNLCTSTAPMSILEEENLTLPNIIRALREGKEQTKNRDNIKDSLYVQLIHHASQNTLYPEGCEFSIYSFSSLVKFPLLEIDFGWGKPVKVSVQEGQCDKFFFLLPNPSGGVDALLTLNERDMSIFERNAELLEFATLVPSCY